MEKQHLQEGFLQVELLESRHGGQVKGRCRTMAAACLSARRIWPLARGFWACGDEQQQCWRSRDNL